MSYVINKIITVLILIKDSQYKIINLSQKKKEISETPNFLFNFVEKHLFSKEINVKLELQKIPTLMAKKSMIQREKNRKRLVLKYFNRRQKLKKQIAKLNFLEEKLIYHLKLQKLPRNSIPVRLHNRCCITGRPKGYFRNFGLSRHLLREMSHEIKEKG
eukprot:TRINITY_DN10723_c2_g1_i1.p3 TRINITY_DN10723_c2_g1~~TRINITY_DN10723_c2_g1_i1.p3  ORF type:complete len:159 (-),score=5.43 TRINITY_DN10723_c2_g1_i1:33-509(-)